jgi:hypothetical protein
VTIAASGIEEKIMKQHEELADLLHRVWRLEQTLEFAETILRWRTTDDVQQEIRDAMANVIVERLEESPQYVSHRSERSTPEMIAARAFGDV